MRGNAIYSVAAVAVELSSRWEYLYVSKHYGYML